MQLHLQSHRLGSAWLLQMCRINFRIMYAETRLIHTSKCSECDHFSALTMRDAMQTHREAVLLDYRRRFMQKGISRHLRAKTFYLLVCVAVSLSLHFIVLSGVRRLHLVCACNRESARLFVCASFVCANKIVAKQQLFIIYCLSPLKHTHKHSFTYTRFRQKVCK